VIIGAGPAGLTAAYELGRHAFPAIVFEADSVVGGISRTVDYRGYRFDIGGHRFFTKVAGVQALWEEVLGDDLLKRPRLSRIYYNDRFFDYPLKPLNALRGLGVVEAVRVGLSYAHAMVFPSKVEDNLEEWVSNRFGRRLYEIFFKTYTEKVWGIPCSEIGAEWAAQRIKNLDLSAAVKNALAGSRAHGGNVITTLIEEFHYPRLGPGMMWERMRDRAAALGVPTVLEARVERIHHDGRAVSGVTVRDRDGRTRHEAATEIISSMPVRTLVEALDPPPPDLVRDAAAKLRYRDFLTVALIVNRETLFPDNWIYIHSPKVQLGRIQNFKNWSPEMVPDPAKTSLGLEYFVQEDDALWSAPDEELIRLGTRECVVLGLLEEREVVDGAVVRMPKAYPVYDGGYREALGVIRGWLADLPNLQLVGRNGQHRYNNQDHSMVTALYATRVLQGEHLDIWDVNVEAEYHEAVRDGEREARGDRLVPARAPGLVTAENIRRIFARYDAFALGASIGAVGALGLFFASVALLLEGREPVGPTLGLLSNYLIGFSVTWPGAFLGALEVLVGGFFFGYVLARAINLVVGWHETAFRRKLEMMRTLD